MCKLKQDAVLACKSFCLFVLVFDLLVLMEAKAEGAELHSYCLLPFI